MTMGTWWALVGMSIAAMGFYGSKGPFFAMPPMFLSGAGLAAGIAWINSIGNLGGFFGPWYVGVDEGPDRQLFAGGLYGLALLGLIAAIVCALFLHIPKSLAGVGDRRARGVKVREALDGEEAHCRDCGFGVFMTTRSRTERAERAMRSVVITGASTGIGWATAKMLLDKGFRVFGSVRRQADADRLKSEFGANFTPLLFDVTDEPAVLAAARQVRTALGGETLAGLVNNAGIAVAGRMLELSADEFRRQMEVNVIGPIIATQAFAPLLGSDPSLKGPRGRIVMISSVAGRKRQPADVGLCRPRSTRSRDCRKACAAS